MKNLNMFKHTALVLIMLISLTTTITQAQNFWELATQKSSNAINDTSCPSYNFGDPEVNVEFQLTLGGEGDNYASDIDYTPDSNYVMLYANNGANFSEFSKTGELLWSQKLFAAEDTVFITSQFVQLDGNYYLAGLWTDYFTTRTFGIMKLDLEGNKQWLKTIFHESLSTKKTAQYINPRITIVENNNFLISFYSRNNLHLVKYDSSFNMIWGLTNEDLNYDGLGLPLKMFLTDNCYTILSNYEYWKIDKLGNIIISDSLLGGYHNNTIFHNNKFYVCGDDYPAHWIRKYSLNFEFEYEYRIVDPNGADVQYKIGSAADIKVLTDCSVLVFYDFEYIGSMEGDIHTNINLLHLDKNLNCLSTINLYAAGSQHANELLIDNNQDYILYGSGYYSFNSRDMLIFAKLGGWPLSVNEKNSILKLNVSPNPVQNVLHIQFDAEKNGILRLFNLDGKLIQTQPIYHEKDATLQMSNYNNGIYLIEFTDELNNRYFSKTIKN